MWEVVKPGTRVGALLETPQVLLTDKRKVLATLLDRVSRPVVLFIDLLLRKKRLGELEQIVHEYEAIVEKQQGIQRATVVSAVPLTREETDRLHGSSSAVRNRRSS
jgi:F0F1-type ATP synthase delta subunit